jgi:hypothetical protein
MRVTRAVQELADVVTLEIEPPATAGCCTPSAPSAR